MLMALARTPPPAPHELPARRFARHGEPLRLYRGCSIEQPVIAYECWGQLNEARDNTVLLYTGLVALGACSVFSYCRAKAAEFKLRLKLVEVFGALQRRQLTFVYTAEDRIDFRELVRDLARRFGGRIEMRQVGVREGARRLGGIDTCGLVLCCAGASLRK